MTLTITESDFGAENVDPGDGLSYQYYLATVPGPYDVLISPPSEYNPTDSYYFFSASLPVAQSGGDTIDVGKGGTYETGAGNDTLLNGEDYNVSPDLYGPNVAMRFLAGPGDDVIGMPYDQFATPPLVQMEAYGGSGNDTLYGTDRNDTLYGDKADGVSGFPTITDVAFNSDTVTDGDDVIHGYGGDDSIDGGGGNDQLFGGDAADTLTGGDGNDFLYGGPRGSNDQDILTGGDGSDVFLLSYEEGDPGGGAGFWPQFFGKMGQDIANNVAKSAIQDAIKAAGSGIATGILASALGPVGGDLAGLFVSLIEDLFASPPPQSKQDVMVVTDFDPREDVLILPIQGSTEGLTADVVQASVIPGGGSLDGSEDVLQFSAGSKVYAYVALSSDYLTAMGLQPSGDAITQVLENIANFSSTIEESSGKIGFSHLVSAEISQALPDGGFQAVPGSLPSGTGIALFGAIGGQVIANGPTGDTYGSILSGTNYDDALTTNPALGAPEQMTSFASTPAYIHGFGGDDLIYGGNGADALFGDDGNDVLYSFYSSSNSDQSINNESLSGGAGDDTLYGGGTAGTFDGGPGSDTFAVIYEAGSNPMQLEVDLTAQYAAERQAPSDTIAPAGTTAPFPDTVPNRYALSNIENVIGGPLNDWIKGAPGSVIEGGPGADYLDATAGGVTISYAHSAYAVVVELAVDGSTAYGGDADGDVIGYTSTTQIQGLVGTADSDVLGAYGEGGTFTFTGNGGFDDFRILGVASPTTFEITDFAGTGTALIDLTAMDITSPDQVTFSGRFAYIAAQAGGPTIATVYVPNYDGTLSAADFFFAPPGAADGDGTGGIPAPSNHTPTRPDHTDWNHAATVTRHWQQAGERLPHEQLVRHDADGMTPYRPDLSYHDHGRPDCTGWNDAATVTPHWQQSGTWLPYDQLL